MPVKESLINTEHVCPWVNPVGTDPLREPVISVEILPLGSLGNERLISGKQMLGQSVMLTGACLLAASFCFAVLRLNLNITPCSLNTLRIICYIIYINLNQIDLERYHIIGVLAVFNVFFFFFFLFLPFLHLWVLFYRTCLQLSSQKHAR